MAMAALDRPTQMNVRISSSLKAAGDALFASWGMTPSEAVRRLYETVVSTGELPRDLAGAAPDHERGEGQSAMESCGLAVRMYRDLTGFDLLPYDGISDDELLGQAFDEMLAADDANAEVRSHG